MSDVVIRGMEMPKNEMSYVECQIWGDGTVYKRRGLAGKLKQAGIAIPLPEGHGRLIDAERFRVILCRLMERQDDDSSTHALRWAIECLDKLESLADAEGENK